MGNGLCGLAHPLPAMPLAWLILENPYRSPMEHGPWVETNLAACQKKLRIFAPQTSHHKMTRTAHRKPPPDHAVSWLFLRSFTGKDSRKGWRGVPAELDEAIPLNKIKYNEQRDEEPGYSYFGALAVIELTDKQRKIIEIIIQTPAITATQMAVIMAGKKRTIERELASLRQKGIIRREGSARNGRWIVNK